MANYYCMIAGLPDIDLKDTKPGLSIEEMREQCEEVLTPGDRKLLFYFFLHFDCVNLVKLLKNPEAEIDQWGNFSLEQLRDLITSATELNFNVHRYPEMAYQFLDYAIKTCPNRMMRRWYKLNLDITNILTAMLARSQGWSVGDFIKGEGEVQEMIRENKTKDFNLGLEFDYIPQLMKIVDEKDPVRKEKMIDAFKWIWLDERTFFEPFDMAAVFAYLCKLEMQERWAKLDVEQGKETFQKIIDDLRSEAQVPEEFKAPTIHR